MLSDDEFEVWCFQHALSEQAKTVIRQIRSSPPSRLVRSAAGNVSGRYPSRKMGCTIQFESHRGELAAIYQFEHDPAVFEFYDQPGVIKLTYLSKKGKQVGVLHTPNFFVVGEQSCGWIECKMEDQLLQLAEQMPHRYQRSSDGCWVCPPGEAYAKPLGLFYRIRSSAQIDWVYQRNLRFLEDYLRASRSPVEAKVAEAICSLVMRRPALTLLELLESLQDGTADDIYFLIATDQLYVALSQTPIAEPEQVQVFLDPEQAEAYAALVSPLYMCSLVDHIPLLLSQQEHCSGGTTSPGEYSILARRLSLSFLQRNNWLIFPSGSLIRCYGRKKLPLPPLYLMTLTK